MAENLVMMMKYENLRFKKKGREKRKRNAQLQIEIKI
jgi:hypothetical protein